MTHYLNNWWLAIRPQTLLASIGPILLGTSMAVSETQIHFGVLAAALICAISLQISVNLANDLFDSLSGVDNEQRLGPIRAVQSGIISISAIKLGLALVCAIAIISGLYLIAMGDYWILLLGMLSLLGVFAYSAGPFPLASNALGEVTVLIFFGWVSVMGSFYLQTGTISIISFGLATSAGLYSCAIMLVNNIRDLVTDRQAEKYTLAVIIGDRKARRLLAVLIVSALVVHLVVTMQASEILWLIPLILALPSYQLIKMGFYFQGRALNQLLANIAKLGFLYCLLVALSWIIFI